MTDKEVQGVADMLKEEDSEEKGNILWEGTLGGHPMRISVSSYSFKFVLGVDKVYYYATVQQGLTDIVHDIVRLNVMKSAKKYETLSDLLNSIKNEYKAIREEIEKYIGVIEGGKGERK